MTLRREIEKALKRVDKEERDPKRLLCGSEAAEYLGISYPTLKKYVEAGLIQTVKTPEGTSRRYNVSALEAFLQNRSCNKEEK